MAETTISASEALALGALDSGVQFVTGYPGSPSTATFEALLDRATGQLRIEWAINEKAAFDAAFGASLANVRCLACMKSVGLNVALDSLMVSNLAPGSGAFVILVGDDPGGWGSQNEEDSRLLASAACVPLLEPTSAAMARSTMRYAFDISGQFQIPVVVRITRALAIDRVTDSGIQTATASPSRTCFKRQGERYNVLPIHVVDYHRALQAKMRQVSEHFETSPWNEEQGSGQTGIIAAGYASSKLSEVLARSSDPPLRCLSLATLNPLPALRVAGFLRGLSASLVLEETAPLLEVQIQAIAQRMGLTLPLYGRWSGHLPGVGELFSPEIGEALTALLPDWQWPPLEPAHRIMPSRQPLCDNCPYIPALETLLAVMHQHGGRDSYVVTGETGCMVRAQLPPWQILDVKYGMGSSIGLAAGLARTGISQRIIALSGDSALLHSGLGELIDAAQSSVSMVVIVLANKTTALSGGQPHPATLHDATGQRRTPVNLMSLVKAAGARSVRVVDPVDVENMRIALQDGLASSGVAVVIAERACPVWPERAAP